MLTKVTYWDFEISNFTLFQLIEFHILPIGKWQIANISEMASRKVERSEIWGSG